MLSTRTQVVGWTLGVASLVGPGPILGRISAGQPPAAESGDSKPLGGTRDLIARLPASVTLAVSIDSAARHRESAPGRALWAFVDDAKLMHRTRSA